ncbi:hypothetical protein CGRA01v4_02731 [Colletotrichum graminicola]|nr:hypothetical protein CGRA01v4_02731 [Colletotrichum graminicola]
MPNAEYAGLYPPRTGKTPAAVAPNILCTSKQLQLQMLRAELKNPFHISWALWPDAWCSAAQHYGLPSTLNPNGPFHGAMTIHILRHPSYMLKATDQGLLSLCLLKYNNTPLDHQSEIRNAPP